MKLKFGLFLFLGTLTAFSQITHKKKYALLGSPFGITVVAKDTVEGNFYVNLAVNEVKFVPSISFLHIYSIKLNF